MKLEILMSCMHQTDDTLVRASRITTDAVVINQCDREGYAEYPTKAGTARIFDTTQRGLTRSRNFAIREAKADICLLCDDDEVFAEGYEELVLGAYAELPQADVIIFKMINQPAAFPDKVMRLRFPQTAHVSSWQISFRRQRLLEKQVAFDELLGAGTDNGAEEELKFMLDCQKAGLRIYYVPVEIATVAQQESTWFEGFNAEFFYNRGATTRYIMGLLMATAYGVYYVLKKQPLYRKNLTPAQALGAIFRGMKDNKITKQAIARRKAGEREE